MALNSHLGHILLFFSPGTMLTMNLFAELEPDRYVALFPFFFRKMQKAEDKVSSGRNF